MAPRTALTAALTWFPARRSPTTSSLLQQATASAGPERHGSGREEGGQAEEQSTPAPALSELKSVVTWLQRGIPFILILLAKVCFQHKLGSLPWSLRASS